MVFPIFTVLYPLGIMDYQVKNQGQLQKINTEVQKLTDFEKQDNPYYNYGCEIDADDVDIKEELRLFMTL